MAKNRMAQIVFATACVVLALTMVGTAGATDCTLPVPYTGTFTVDPGGSTISGTGSLSGDQGCSGVIQQDKLWNNFSFSQLASIGGSLAFDFSKINGEDVHTLGFQSPFGSGGPNATYSWSYSISILPGMNLQFKDAAAGLVQGRGSANLMTMLTDNLGNNYMIDLTYVGAVCQAPCNNLVDIASGATSLMVSDQLTIGPNGGNVTGVSNSFTEITAVPEPGTLALLGSSMLGVAGLLRRKLA